MITVPSLCFVLGANSPSIPCLYTSHPTLYTRKIAFQGNFSCTYQKKALLLQRKKRFFFSQNDVNKIYKQLWNTNLVLDVVLCLFVSTRIPLSANAQAWNSRPLLVHIWLRNTPTNASAASACWSCLSRQSIFVVPNLFGHCMPLNSKL